MYLGGVLFRGLVSLSSSGPSAPVVTSSWSVGLDNTVYSDVSRLFALETYWCGEGALISHVVPVSTVVAEASLVLELLNHFFRR